MVTNTLAFPQGAIAARLARVPHVWYAREFVEVPDGFRFVLGPRISFKIVDALSARIVACSEALATKLSEEIDASKVRAVHAAFELAPSTSGGERLDSEELRLLMLGRFHFSKGQQDAIRAAAILAARGRKVRLSLVGTDEAGQEEALRGLADELGVSDRVAFLGPSARPQELLDACDVLLMCSRSEGFSRVVIEAMKAGKPVIASHIPSSVEQVRDGVTGFLYEPGDTEALATHIERFDDDRALALSMGAEAKRWADSHFNLERYGRELADTLSGAMSQAPA